MTLPGKPSLKPGNEREPSPATRVPIHFRPPRSFIHMISDGEDWASLGKRYRVPAGRIVQDNFRTQVPEEINWYLNHYVDCDTPTPDRYNWTFTTSARGGTSPRAGVIYVVPGWPSIFADVRRVIRATVDDWFRLAQLDEGHLQGSTLFIPEGSVSTRSTRRDLFLRELIGAGAPDSLARAIRDTLWEALGAFTASLTEVREGAVPRLPPGHAGPVAVAPWALLSTGSSSGVVRTQHLRGQIMTRLGPDAPAGAMAASDVASWFERSFEVFRGGTLVRRVLVRPMGPAMRRGAVQGRVLGLPTSFLTPGSMPE